jgi:hypothetical protein
MTGDRPILQRNPAISLRYVGRIDDNPGNSVQVCRISIKRDRRLRPMEASLGARKAATVER